MKLKTLKDLKRYCRQDTARRFKTGHRKNTRGYRRVVDFNELREEAIKWVKLYKDNDIVPKELKMFSGEIGFIKHFFNITEEDLI